MFIEKKICVVEDKSRKFKTYFLCGIKPYGQVIKFESIEEYLKAESEKGFTDNEFDRVAFVKALLAKKLEKENLKYEDLFYDEFGVAWPAILKSLSHLAKYPKNGLKVKNPRYVDI